MAVPVEESSFFCLLLSLQVRLFQYLKTFGKDFRLIAGASTSHTSPSRTVDIHVSRVAEGPTAPVARVDSGEPGQI